MKNLTNLLLAMAVVLMVACTDKNEPSNESANNTYTEQGGGNNGGNGSNSGSSGGSSAPVIGTLSGAFSVSADTKIYFSQGNLQYQASTNIWRFATHQYDTIGATNKNISATYDGWIDLFGWVQAAMEEYTEHVIYRSIPAMIPVMMDRTVTMVTPSA